MKTGDDMDYTTKFNIITRLQANQAGLLAQADNCADQDHRRRIIKSAVAMACAMAKIASMR